MASTCHLLHSARCRSMTLRNCTTDLFQKSTTQRAELCLSATAVKLQKVWVLIYTDSSFTIGRVTAGATKAYLLKNPATSESPELADAACAAWKAWQWLRAGVPKHGLIHGDCHAPVLLFKHTPQHPLTQPTTVYLYFWQIYPAQFYLSKWQGL